MIRTVAVAVCVLLAALAAVAPDRHVAGRDYGEGVPALTDSRGRILDGDELDRLRSFYARHGLDQFLDFDYVIDGDRFVWLGGEPLLAVWVTRHPFDGYREAPRIAPTVYDLAGAPRGVPIFVIPQGLDAWPVCTASWIVL